MSFLDTAATIAATALASGSIAAVVTHFLTADRERRSILRQKAEDLYVSAEAWENSWGLTLVSLMGVVNNTITYDQHNDIPIAQGKSTDGSLNRRVHMLTEIYFPTALKRLDSVMQALDEFNRVRAVHRAAYADGAFDVLDWHEDFMPKINAVTTEFKTYRDTIVRCA